MTDKNDEDETPLSTQLLQGCIHYALLIGVLIIGVQIRLYAVINYGRVIHEFDPWFNFRATQYLVDHGYEKWSTWYDDKVWYPLGRPVGSTLYPGMMLTAAWIFRAFEHLVPEWGVTLNDVCVFIPAGFSVFAVLFTYGIAKEASGSRHAALATAFLMAIMPAHLMRSVAGGFDNESVAISAICSTFYLWVRSLRPRASIIWAVLCAVSYTYMVAAWGAYTFVLNMIGVHAAMMIAIGQFSWRLHTRYSVWYVLGTAGALTVPIVGWQPLQSMEQLGPLAIFAVMQLLGALHYYRRHYAKHMEDDEFKALTFRVCVVAAAGGSMVLGAVLPPGFIGPLSARVRGLFVPHTRTGNPLVDSVAEHQATPASMYAQYFHIARLLAPIGFVACFKRPTPARTFLVAYVMVSYYFSSKMVRLVLLLSPAAAAAAGYGLELTVRWCFRQLRGDDDAPAADAPAAGSNSSSSGRKGTARSGKAVAGKKSRTAKKKEAAAAAARSGDAWEAVMGPLREEYERQTLPRRVAALTTLAVLAISGKNYWDHCHALAQNLSEPQIVLTGRSQSGAPIIIDDFRESYWWLRDNTPEDSRVMAWWDYGYQINGVANRTTIADGNTWNHEHIALLGRCLISEEEEAHKLIIHLADYVLVWTTRWAGMWGDDLAKHPHMARIGGSVYKSIDPDAYWVDRDGNPSPATRKSLLYRIHSGGLDPNVPALNPKYFTEAYTSKNRMVRIFKVEGVSQESKAEIERTHTYPKALAHILAQKNDFKQH